MQCPFCGAEMEKGFIYGRRDIGLLWLPQGEKLPPMLTENAVDKRHGLLLGKGRSPNLPSWTIMCAGNAARAFQDFKRINIPADCFITHKSLIYTKNQ